MLRHVVLWTLKDAGGPEQKRENAAIMKAKLEELQRVLPGIRKLEVSINPNDGPDADVMMDSVFESQQAFDDYLDDPRHLVVSKFVASVRQDRMCMDYEMDAIPT